MSDRLSRLLKAEIDKINLHLPKKVISLREVGSLENAGVYQRDGYFNSFDEKELEKMRKLIPKQFWGHVILPIIITRRRDLGKGVFSVGSSEANLYLIRQLITDLPSYDIWRINGDKNFTIYKIYLRKIRKEFSTTTVIAFT